jgi:hypothetical protein
MIELNPGVIDAKAAERSQQMFDRFDRRLVSDESGLQLLPAAQVRNMGWNLQPWQVSPLKPDTGVGRSWLERESDLVTGMQTNSGASDRSANRAL